MARIRYGEQVKDRITKVIVEALTTIGWEVALEAYRRRTYTNRTYNLHDSYGSAVFVDGVLVPDSVKMVERAMSKKGKTRDVRGGKSIATGREAFQHFLDTTFIVRKKDHITLVVAAAMWYGEMVESKGYVVLDEQYIKSAVSHRWAFVLPQIMAKYPDVKDFLPMIRRWVGIDEVFHYNI